MDLTYPPARGYVTSDLHIFGCNSLYEALLPIFYQQATRHPNIVLNGDTFDFKRAPFKSSLETSKHAVAWLYDLCQRASGSSIFFILGNHDCHETFVKALQAASSALPNLRMAREQLRIGTCLFLHGDAIDLADEMPEITHVRSCYSQVEPHWSARACAELITRLGLNKFEYLRHSPTRVAQKILKYLRATQPNSLEGVRQIYFGHTHVPIDHFEYDDFIFYNTGSMIRGLRWNPLEFA